MTKKEITKLTQEEYEKKVLTLAKEGLTSEKIGQKLKDEGIHPSEYNGKISKILGKEYINPDLKNTEEKFGKVKSHFEKNPQDKKAKREKDRLFSKLRKVKRYFKIETK